MGLLGCARWRCWDAGASVRADLATRVLLVHGALCDADVWAPQVAALKLAGFEPTSLQLEGFYPSQFNPARFSADRHVAQIVSNLNLIDGCAHVVGHSRGGRLALHAAAQVPGKVASLVLVEAGGTREPEFLDAPPSPPATFEVEVLAMLAQGQTVAAARTYIEGGHGPGAWDLAPELLRKLAIRNAATIQGTLTDKSCPLSRAIARQIQCSTLLLEGDQSPSIFHRIADVLEETMPSARRRRIANGDHFMSLHRTTQFNDALIAFLAGEKSRLA